MAITKYTLQDQLQLHQEMERLCRRSAKALLLGEEPLFTNMTTKLIQMVEAHTGLTAEELENYRTPPPVTCRPHE